MKERRLTMINLFNYKPSLKRDLSMGIILLAVPIFILSIGTMFYQSRYMIHNEVKSSNSNMLNKGLYQIRSYMTTIETAVNSNAWLMEENLVPDTLKSLSERIVRLNDPVVSCSVFMIPDYFKEYGSKFSVYAASQGDTVKSYIESEYDYFNRSMFSEPVKTGKACWIDPFIEYIDGKVDHNEAVATYSRPLRQKNGRIVGVLSAEMSFSQLTKLINKTSLEYNGAFFVLLDGTGRFLINPDTTHLFRKTIFSDAEPNKNADIISLGYEMIAGKHGNMHVSYNNKLYHVTFRPVPGTRWSLALARPDKEAMKSYYHMGYMIFAIIMIGLLIIVWVSRQVAKQTITPILHLLDVTKKISNGNFDEPIPVSKSNGVLGHLQNSFVKMQRSIHDNMTKLRNNADMVSKANEEMQQAQLLTEDAILRKSQFLQTVSQNMRMPINVITGFAEVLRDSSGSNTTLDENEFSNISKMMKENAITLNRLMLLLLDTSQTDANGELHYKKNDEVSVNLVAKDCIRHTLSHFPDARIKLETDLPSTLHIVTNRLYLFSTLSELLYNAAKYTGGQNVTLQVSQTETTIRYTVLDVGSGLPSGAMEKVFQPFNEAANLAEGEGLGLPLVKRHAASLGGDLIFDVDYRDGCRIIFELQK
ncbi:MAG: HAMP domain-containing protein [Prevotella ruminicola]|jgi:signal transduction histidine kinase|uniref:histidine kinase n=1 Tax=Xylanibacter ruminicola TaxID=839 RepID=A0A928BSU7_XYLRU|nr:HAMP domain-containing protein [Xylanibacter ruminicola]